MELLKAPLRPMVHALRALRRKRELERTLPATSSAELMRQLEAVPLPEQPVLLVHSSLKQLGFVEGGADGVVDALVEVVVSRRRGTLVLPTFSIDGSMHNSLAGGAVFDVRSTPSNLGAIPEAFRRRPGVRRSIHPTHSFAALGPRADWIVAEHHRCGSSFGADSPMVRAMEADARLAGLGTNLGNVTFYHCLEDSEPDFPLRVYTSESPYRVHCIGWDGMRHEWQLPAHDPAVSRTRIDHKESTAIRSFFQTALEQHAGLQWFAIGHGRGWVVPMHAMYGECVRLMRRGITIYSTAEDLAAADRAMAVRREA